MLEFRPLVEVEALDLIKLHASEVRLGEFPIVGVLIDPVGRVEPPRPFLGRLRRHENEFVIRVFLCVRACVSRPVGEVLVRGEVSVLLDPEQVVRLVWSRPDENRIVLRCGRPRLLGSVIGQSHGRVLPLS